MSSYPLFALSLLFLVSFMITLDGTSSAGEKEVASIIMPVTWVAFAIDYAIGLALSQDRWHFVKTHLIQAAALLFPPLRVLLLGHAFNVLRRTPLRRGDRARTYVLYLTTLVLVMSAIMVVYFERQAPNANLTTFGNALWWGGETVSTVGYGDYYPVTVGGRIVAGLLFVNGVALLSIITAGLAQNFTSDDARKSAGKPRATKATDPQVPDHPGAPDHPGDAVVPAAAGTGGAGTGGASAPQSLVTVPSADLDRLHERIGEMERMLATISANVSKTVDQTLQQVELLAPPAPPAAPAGPAAPGTASRQPDQSPPPEPPAQDTPPAAPRG